MIKLVRLVSSVILLSVASVTAHAGLIINAADEITGVEGIMIDGVSRTFDFMDGSFNGLFGGVVPSGNFFAAASDIKGMFPEGSRITPLDLSRIVGCQDGCNVIVPVGVVPMDDEHVLIDSFNLRRFGFFDGPVQRGNLDRDFDSDICCGVTFAVLRPTDVPEPSTMGLLGLSLLGLGFVHRAKNKA